MPSEAVVTLHYSIVCLKVHSQLCEMAKLSFQVHSLHFLVCLQPKAFFGTRAKTTEEIPKSVTIQVRKSLCCNVLILFEICNRSFPSWILSKSNLVQSFCCRIHSNRIAADLCGSSCSLSEISAKVGTAKMDSNGRDFLICMKTDDFSCEAFPYRKPCV